jgi:5-methylcytosine-specific restriction endonuclease McrA
MSRVDMKKVRILSLAQKARLSKKKLKRYRNKTKNVKIVRSFTGVLVEKKKYDKYKRYIKSKWWALKKEQALDYYEHRCGNCGSRYSLQVHHKNYKTLYKEQMCDLMLLCETCHLEHHKK